MQVDMHTTVAAFVVKGPGLRFYVLSLEDCGHVVLVDFFEHEKCLFSMERAMY